MSHHKMRNFPLMAIQNDITFKKMIYIIEYNIIYNLIVMIMFSIFIDLLSQLFMGFFKLIRQLLPFSDFQ